MLQRLGHLRTNGPSRCGGTESAVVGRSREPRESECCHEKPSARVEHALLDHLVCPLEQRLRDRQPERLRGLHIDDQLKLGGLLDRQVTRLGAFQNLVDVGGDRAQSIQGDPTVAQQTSRLYPPSTPIHRRQFGLCRELDKLVPLSWSTEWSASEHDQRIGVSSFHRCKRPLKFLERFYDRRQNREAETPRGVLNRLELGGVNWVVGHQSG